VSHLAFFIFIFEIWINNTKNSRSYYISREFVFVWNRPSGGFSFDGVHASDFLPCTGLDCIVLLPPLFVPGVNAARDGGFQVPLDSSREQPILLFHSARVP